MTAREVLTPEELWRRYDGVESRLTAPLSERMLDLAGVRPGMRVLDLATGRGEPALRAARRAAPDGFVVGVELADGVLEMAREKARRSCLSNLDLRVADAASAQDIASNYFHAATVRWGLMYMAAPVAALMNAHRALLPTGVLVAALWAEPERVPYYTLPRRLLQRYRALPPVDPEAPGTFRYADLERVARDFGRAGFLLDHVEEMDVTVFEAETDAEIVDWVRALARSISQARCSCSGRLFSNWVSPFCLARRWCEIDQIAVDPSRRRRGIARALIQEAIQNAAADGIRDVELSAWSFNDEAHETFRRLGFVPKVIRFELAAEKAK